ncbi:hypothetical protein [Limosilactobacillus mucosae]|nr:hypothetical protein [Limosilactobacillus mucosae]
MPVRELVSNNRAAERELGFMNQSIRNYLKRRQETPYLGRYEVERG